MKARSFAFLRLIVAMSISFFLLGCGNEITPAESNDNQNVVVSALTTSSNTVKLTLRPGVQQIHAWFQSKDIAKQQEQLIRNEITRNGGTLVGSAVNELDGWYLYAKFYPMKNNVTIKLERTGFIRALLRSVRGDVAVWDPSRGNEVQYIAPV